MWKKFVSKFYEIENGMYQPLFLDSPHIMYHKICRYYEGFHPHLAIGCQYLIIHSFP